MPIYTKYILGKRESRIIIIIISILMWTLQVATPAQVVTPDVAMASELLLDVNWTRKMEFSRLGQWAFRSRGATSNLSRGPRGARERSRIMW